MPNDSKADVLKRADLLLGDLQHALSRLAAALKQPEDEFIRDAAIQRFEFCFELAWKGIQAAARLEGQDCASPRTAFSTAWRNGWIGDEAACYRAPSGLVARVRQIEQPSGPPPEQ